VLIIIVSCLGADIAELYIHFQRLYVLLLPILAVSGASPSSPITLSTIPKHELNLAISFAHRTSVSGPIAALAFRAFVAPTHSPPPCSIDSCLPRVDACRR
jgi:hypothetical protein